MKKFDKKKAKPFKKRPNKIKNFFYIIGAFYPQNLFKKN